MNYQTLIPDLKKLIKTSLEKCVLNAGAAFMDFVVEIKAPST